MLQLSGEEKIYIWLDSFALTEQEKQKLLFCAGNAKKLLSSLPAIFPSVIKSGKESVYNNMLASLQDGGKYFQKVLSSLESAGVTPLPFPSERYPKAFKTLSAPPLVLYCKGDISLLKNKLFAVVGSRITPETAMRTGKKIAKELSEHFTILTGTADGGDTAAIEGALAGNGKVVCFTAGGMDELPKNNAPLLEKAVKNGLIISACAPSVSVRNFSFERRNALLAELSNGVLVLSAGEKSGALITAKYAKKAKKEIFALPYPPEAPSGVGCNALIKQGAHLTENSEDILSVYGIKTREKTKPAISLTSEEQVIVEVLKKEQEISLSVLAVQTKIPAYKLAGLITALEVKGVIAKTGGNRIALIK